MSKADHTLCLCVCVISVSDVQQQQCAGVGVHREEPSGQEAEDRLIEEYDWPATFRAYVCFGIPWSTKT